MAHRIALFNDSVYNNEYYYMNSSLSWNDVLNQIMCFDWLQERTEWSCPLGRVRLRWLLILILDIDLVLFFHV